MPPAYRFGWEAARLVLGRLSGEIKATPKIELSFEIVIRTDLLRIVEDLDRRGVGLITLSMGGQQIDTRSPTGKLMVTMLAAIAEFECGLLLERQKEGVAKA